MFQILNGGLIVAQGETKAACIEALSHAPLPTVVRIDREGDTQTAIVCHKYWINKEVRKSQYSLEFSRRDILNDMAVVICSMHGYRLQHVTDA